MALTDNTQVLDLTAGTPLDLTETRRSAAGVTLPGWFSTVRVQNTGSGRVYYAERATAPGASDTGHVLGPQDSFVVTLWADCPAFVWTPDATGRVAVTDA